MIGCRFKSWPTNSTCMCGRCAPRRMMGASPRRSARDRFSESSPQRPLARPAHNSWRRGIAEPMDVADVVPWPCAAWPCRRITRPMLVGLRHRLGLSQHELAAKVGAASKAVVYQWESGKRKPSPVFWLRIVRLQRRLPQ